MLIEGSFTEYVASLKSLIDDRVPNPNKVSLVAQVLIPVYFYVTILIIAENPDYDMISTSGISYQGYSALQGYFAPVVVKYAFEHQEKVNDLILLNPPVCF